MITANIKTRIKAVYDYILNIFDHFLDYFLIGLKVALIIAASIFTFNLITGDSGIDFIGMWFFCFMVFIMAEISIKKSAVLAIIMSFIFIALI